MSVLSKHWQVNGCTVTTLVSQCLFCYDTGKSIFIAIATNGSDRPSLIGCHGNRKVFITVLFLLGFGFKSGICLLIAPVPVHCFSITFITDFPLNNHERCEVGTEHTCLKQVLKLELNTFLYNVNLYIHVNKVLQIFGHVCFLFLWIMGKVEVAIYKITHIKFTYMTLMGYIL